MKSMKRIAVVTALALCFPVAACGGDPESTEPNLRTSPSGGIDIRGEITQLSTPLPGVSRGALEVQGEEASDTKYHRRATLWIVENVVVQRKQGADVFPASVVDLEVGKRVEIKFEGVVAELDPVQASAGEITILD